MTINHPQFGVVRVLRGYSGFESLYEGQPATGATAVPIMLSEAGIELDDMAQQRVAGYDPDLVRGLPVVAGSDLLLWVPNLLGVSLPNVSPYVYQIVWRYRNTADYRRNRTPYHYPKQIEGVPETLLNLGERVVIPAAMEAIIYNQAEPAVGASVAQNLHTEGVAIGGFPINPPINSNGAQGVIQQGILPSGANRSHTRPIYSPWTLTAKGDELLVAVTRLTDLGGAAANWDFSGFGAEDSGIANVYGSGGGGPYPDLGLYVVGGIAS